MNIDWPVMFALPTAFLHLVGAWGVGRILCQKAGHLAGLLLGMGGLCVFTLVIGLLGFLTKPLMGFMWSIWVVIGLYRLNFEKSIFGYLKNTFDGIPIILLIIGGLIAIPAWSAGVIGALAPPIAYDDLNYHLAVPNSWLIQGKITPEFDLSHAFFPMLLELNGLWLLALVGDSAARCLNPFLALLSGWGVINLLKKTGNIQAGFIASIWYLVTPILVLELPMLAVEVLLGLCMVVILSGLIELKNNQLEKGLWMVCLGIAVAISQKYTMIALIPIFGFSFIWMIYKRKILITPWLIGIGISSPFYVRNLFWTGNPFYPFFGEHFPNQLYWNENLVIHYEKMLYSYGGYGKSFLNFLLLPWDLIRSPEVFHGYYHFALILLPLTIIFTKRISKESKLGIVFWIYGLLIWFQGSQDVRHLFPWSILLLPALAECLGIIGKKQIIILYLGFLLVGLPHTAQALLGSDNPIKPIKVIVGNQSKKYFQIKNSPMGKDYSKVCSSLKSQEKILLLDNLSLTYNLPCKASRGNLYFQGYWDFWEIKTPDEFLFLAKKRNITHILSRPAIRDSKASYIPPHYKNLMVEIEENYSLIVFSGEQTELRKLKFDTDG